MFLTFHPSGSAYRQPHPGARNPVLATLRLTIDNVQIWSILALPTWRARIRRWVWVFWCWCWCWCWLYKIKFCWSPRWPPSPQCSTFTGMIPVFGVLLILFEWYWYVVCESGIRTSLILAQGNRWKCTAKAKHDWRSYVFRSQRSAVFTSAHSPQAPSRATQPTSQLAAAS